MKSAKKSLHYLVSPLSVPTITWMSLQCKKYWTWGHLTSSTMTTSPLPWMKLPVNQVRKKFDDPWLGICVYVMWSTGRERRGSPQTSKLASFGAALPPGNFDADWLSTVAVWYVCMQSTTTQCYVMLWVVSVTGSLAFWAAEFPALKNLCPS